MKVPVNYILVGDEISDLGVAYTVRDIKQINETKFEIYGLDSIKNTEKVFVFYDGDSVHVIDSSFDKE